MKNWDPLAINRINIEAREKVEGDKHNRER
jgi:hypothetical protein